VAWSWTPHPSGATQEPTLLQTSPIIWPQTYFAILISCFIFYTLAKLPSPNYFQLTHLPCHILPPSSPSSYPLRFMPTATSFRKLSINIHPLSRHEHLVFPQWIHFPLCIYTSSLLTTQYLLFLCQSLQQSTKFIENRNHILVCFVSPMPNKCLAHCRNMGNNLSVEFVSCKSALVQH
jgi:hypothetical protein